jgi:lipopolysaccharide export LptBFGC system permease protein LptF
VLFVLPPIVETANAPVLRAHNAARLAVYLIPQAVVLSIPVAACVGVLCGLRGRRVSRRSLRNVMVFALACGVAALAAVEWFVPWGNQAFREFVAAQLQPGTSIHLEPGLNEIGLSGLIRRGDITAIRHLHVIVALCLSTIPLALLAHGVAERIVRRAPAIGAAVGLCAAYVLFVLMLDERTANAPPLLAAWGPDVILFTAAVALLRRAHRQPSPPARLT